MLLFLPLVSLHASSGEACPLCSGSTYVLSEDLYLQKATPFSQVYNPKFKLSSIYAPSTRGVGISYLSFSVVEKLRLGVGIGWRKGRVLLSGNYRVNKETDRIPSFVIGAGSSRIEHNMGSFYLVGAKKVRIKNIIKLFAGISVTFEGQDFAPITGAVVPIGRLLMGTVGYFGDDELHFSLYSNALDFMTLGVKFLHAFSDNDVGIYAGLNF